MCSYRGPGMDNHVSTPHHDRRFRGLVVSRLVDATETAGVIYGGRPPERAGDDSSSNRVLLTEFNHTTPSGKTF